MQELKVVQELNAMQELKALQELIKDHAGIIKCSAGIN